MNSNNKISNYVLKEKLGKGSYGEVYRVMEKNTKNIYALKEIKLTGLKKTEIQELMKEANLLKSLCHENIVKIEDSFEYDNNQKFGMVLELCDGGDLSKFIKEHKLRKKHLEESKIIEIFKQILNGLEYLHSKKIIHRDMKTLNIFLHKDGRVKIGDLGIAKVLLYSSCAHTVIGTPLYLAPEICQEKPYNEKSDIWSLGCILYELITFSVPFNAPNYVGLCGKISKGVYDPVPSEIKKLYSNELLKLIEVILQRNPDKRPTVKDIKSFKIFNFINEQLIGIGNNEIKSVASDNALKKVSNEEKKKGEVVVAKPINRPLTPNVKKDKNSKFNLNHNNNDQKNHKGFNYDHFIRNKLDNPADKDVLAKNKKLGVNNHHIDNYHNNHYVHHHNNNNNLFNKKNENNNINNNKFLPIDKFKIEVKKPVEFKNILIDKEHHLNANNNLINLNNNNNNNEAKNYHLKNNLDKNNDFCKPKQNECVDKYNHLLGNLKNILEQSKLLPNNNNININNKNDNLKNFEAIKKKREIKSAKELPGRNNLNNNNKNQAKKISNKNLPNAAAKKNNISAMPKRVRVNPKDGQQDVLARQAQLAKEKKKENEKQQLEAAAAPKHYRIPSSDDVMRKLDDFEKKLKFSKEIEEPLIYESNIQLGVCLDDKRKNYEEKNLKANKNMDQTGLFFNDKLSASAFFKKLINNQEKNFEGNNHSIESKENKNQNENYKRRAVSKKDSNEKIKSCRSYIFDNDSLILDDDNKDVLHDLLENSFNEKNKNYYQFDLNKFKTDEINEKTSQMILRGVDLIGENAFNKIYEFYRTLQENNEKITEKDNSDLNALIKITVKEAEYTELAYFDCLRNLKESEKYF